MFRVITFGESHGPACGCVVDGCPAGLSLTTEDVARDLRRRRPGFSPASTSRLETDEPELLSGIFEGKTLGTPIAILIRNQAQHSADYEKLRDLYRPGHADWTWETKFGFRDHRGGGRSSGRETVGRVAAGAVARAFLATMGIRIRAWSSSIAGIEVPDFQNLDFEEAEQNGLQIPDKESALKIRNTLEQLKKAGDSAGGIVSCRVSGLPPGLGEPVFDKLNARLAAAILSIGAAKGIEFGAGFDSARQYGSIHNDRPVPDFSPRSKMPESVPGIRFETNNAGGILGGISTGRDVEFKVAFKPVPSIAKTQKTVNRSGTTIDLSISGRHDVCIVPRAVPVVEAMAGLVLADALLQNRSAYVSEHG
ncbi:chorismate synthase [Spirochaetia bacterium]|nr:chorismate synthase [Spirochaetia bacterium]